MEIDSQVQNEQNLVSCMTSPPNFIPTSSSLFSLNTTTTTMEANSCKNSFYSLKNIILIFFLCSVGVFFLSFLYSNSSKSVFNSHSLQCPLSHPNKTTLQNPRDELEEALGKVSMKNKTIIIAVVNKAYVEGVANMLDVFLEGFWTGEGTRELVNHMLIVAVDQTAYERCLYRGLHCYRLVTDGVDFTGEKVFMSNEFIKMMWRRTLFLLEILKRGYNFIFTDTDVIWFRNPLPALLTNDTQDLDIQFSVDKHNGDSSSPLNPINTGFYFVKSNNKTISLFNKWYSLKDNSAGMKEQDVLQNLVRQGVVADLGLKARFLENGLFSGFCQKSPDVRTVITMHAICCRFISAKVADLTRVLMDWARFKANTTIATTSFQWSPHEQCRLSWRRKD